MVDLPFLGEEEFHEDTWIELDPIAEGKGRDEDDAPVAVVEEVVEVEPDVVEEVVEPEAVVEPERGASPRRCSMEERRRADEPEVAEAVVEEADEGVLDDLEPVALAAAVAAPGPETPDAEPGNGVDPVLAAAAAERSWPSRNRSVESSRGRRRGAGG